MEAGQVEQTVSSQKCGSERRPEGGVEERGREKERGQHIHGHTPLLVQHLLFGFFHSDALQWPCHMDLQHIKLWNVYLQQLLGIH